MKFTQRISGSSRQAFKVNESILLHVSNKEVLLGGGVSGKE